MKHILYILLILSLASCANDKISSLMDEADRIFDTDPEKSLSIMQTIDVNELFGKSQHARYGLLYTRACYKNYVDAESDSLILAAANYYEENGTDKEKFFAYLYLGFVQLVLKEYDKASNSLMKAMNYSESIDSHFYKGQLYSHLAKINAAQHCSDEEIYARKAYYEYKTGGYEDYLSNAMVQLAEAKFHAHDFDSCQIWADSSLIISITRVDTTSIIEGIRMKINTAIVQSQYESADSLYKILIKQFKLRASSQDLSRLALIAAHKNNRNDAIKYLDLSSKYRNTYNDTVNYYARAYNVYKYLKDYDKLVLYQDSLLRYEDSFLNEALKHTSLAAQKEYSELLLMKSEYQRKKMFQIFIMCFLGLLLLIYFMFLYIKQQKLQLELREEKIKNLQNEIAKNTEVLKSGLNNLRQTEIFSTVKACQGAKKCLAKAQWNELSLSFDKYLPLFEKSLKDIYPISEEEWKVCMLLKLGYSPTDLSYLISKSSSGISSVRSRLYSKFFGKKGQPSDWDAFINSI